MPAAGIVGALDEVEDGYSSLRAEAEAVPVEQLAFQRGEEALTRVVVVGVADARSICLI
jgi:hypothetical protein